MNLAKYLLTTLLCLTVSMRLGAQSDWNEPFPPHRIADRLYYVGSKGLASYLLTTSQGSILINSGFERTVPIIRANVEKLGFKFTDIRILRLLKSMPCDLFLGAHGSYYSMEDKFKKLEQDPKTNPFVDPEGYRAYVENRCDAFREKLKP